MNTLSKNSRTSSIEERVANNEQKKAHCGNSHFSCSLNLLQTIRVLQLMPASRLPVVDDIWFSGARVLFLFLNRDSWRFRCAFHPNIDAESFSSISLSAFFSQSLRLSVLLQPVFQFLFRLLEQSLVFRRPRRLRLLPIL